MKKRILYMILAALILSLMWSVGVSASIDTAGELYCESFSAPDGAASDWKPDGWNFEALGGTGLPDSQTKLGVTADGHMILERGVYDGTVRVMYSTYPNIPSDFTYMIDVRATGGKSAWVISYINGYYISVTASGAVEYMDESGSNGYKNFGVSDGVWYTYCFQVKGERMSAYRKEYGEGKQFELLLADVKMQRRTGTGFYAYGTTGSDRVEVDNIRITEGIFPVESAIDVDGENGIISGKMTVYAGNVSPTTLESAMALMAVHDKNGKIIDIVSKPVTLAFGDNTIEIEKEYTDEKFEKMSGGTAKIYLWDSFEGLDPLTKAYSVVID